MGLTYPDLGETASYTFKAPIATLSGIYTLTKTLSFQATVDEGISLYDTLYAPLDVSEEIWDTDWPTFRTDTILKLDDANHLLDEDRDEIQSYYIPTTLISGIPDPNVLKVWDLFLTISLGEFEHPSEVAHAQEQLNDIAASVSGTTDTARLFSAEETWMTRSDYDAIATTRAARIDSLELQSVVIRRQAEENRKLKAKYAALESAYLALAT